MMSLVYSSFSAKRDKMLVKFEYSSAIFVNKYVSSHKDIMVDTFFKLMFMSVVLKLLDIPDLVFIPKFPFLFI